MSQLSKQCTYAIVVQEYSYFRKVKCRVGRNQEFSGGFGQSLARKLQTQGKTCLVILDPKHTALRSTLEVFTVKLGGFSGFCDRFGFHGREGGNT